LHFSIKFAISGAKDTFNRNSGWIDEDNATVTHSSAQKEIEIIWDLKRFKLILNIPYHGTLPIKGFFNLYERP